MRAASDSRRNSAIGQIAQSQGQRPRFSKRLVFGSNQRDTTLQTPTKRFQLEWRSKTNIDKLPFDVDRRAKQAGPYIESPFIFSDDLQRNSSAFRGCQWERFNRSRQ